MGCHKKWGLKKWLVVWGGIFGRFGEFGEFGEFGRFGEFGGIGGIVKIRNSSSWVMIQEVPMFRTAICLDDFSIKMKDY